jgi:hypothetical protein
VQLDTDARIQARVRLERNMSRVLGGMHEALAQSGACPSSTRRFNPKGPRMHLGLLAICAQEPNSPKPQPTALIHSVHATRLPTLVKPPRELSFGGNDNASAKRPPGRL